jgi:hypothetical protein
MVEEGTVALQKSQFTLALSQLNKAKGLSAQFSIPQVSSFDSLHQRAMKHYLLIRLSVSQKKIWANQFDSARAALEKTQRAADENNLAGDPDLALAMAKFKVKIQEQQCRNLQDSIDLQIIRADRSISLGNYINAGRYFNLANGFCKSDSACHCDPSPLTDSITRYKNASQYQENIHEINALVVMGEYLRAFDLFEKNQQLYDSTRLSVFKLQKTGLYEFVAAKNNPNVAEAAARFLFDSGNSKEALRCLLLYPEQNHPSPAMKKLQENIGKSLAMADSAGNLQEDPKVALQKYHAETNGFEPFRNAYLKEFEKKR